jgi:hypothetical protein
MLFIFLSSFSFSVLTVASAAPELPAVPVVTPGAALGPDDCAVPRLLVPGGGAGELATPPVDPAGPPTDPAAPPPDPVAPPVACANDAAGMAARARITIAVLIEPNNLAIGDSPLPVNGRKEDLFRNKRRHISLKSEEGKSR